VNEARLEQAQVGNAQDGIAVQARIGDLAEAVVGRVAPVG
jgi:hypothetical protein